MRALGIGRSSHLLPAHIRLLTFVTHTRFRQREITKSVKRRYEIGPTWRTTTAPPHCRVDLGGSVEERGVNIQLIKSLIKSANLADETSLQKNLFWLFHNILEIIPDLFPHFLDWKNGGYILQWNYSGLIHTERL